MARNTVKDDVFLTPQAKNTVNRGGVDTGWVGGRGRRPLVTTEGLRQGHGLRGRRPDLKVYAWQPGAGQATKFGLWCGKIGPRFSAQTQGGLCWTEAGIMRSACLYGSGLGLLKVVAMLSNLGLILGLCWAKSGPCWAIGPMLAQVGPMLSYVHLCSMLGLCWAHVGLYWAYVGPCWAILGAMLGPCLGHLCWNDLKMPIFPPRAPPGAQNIQNHVKTEGL